MSKHPINAYSLVADVGGTNTRVALADGLQLLPATIRKYANADFDGLETVLRQYVNDEDDVECANACAAVAGPVRDGVAELTNVDWSIDRETLIRATGAQNVSILNDLQAQGHALGLIEAQNLTPIINRNAAPAGATMLVIGVGTGINAATAIFTDHGRIVPPSECGHSSLPLRTQEDLRFAQFVEAIHGYPSAEDALSGTGLENIYRWFGHEAGDNKRLSATQIMSALATGTDERAKQTAGMFCGFLGAVAGDMSLVQLPFGGVFLIGGVARAMAPYLIEYGFGAAFCDKGRMSGFMENFAVSVIADDFAALTGCASHLADVT